MHDYHIHTSFCKHAEGEISQYIEAAVDKGISEICFTDHIPMPNGFDSDHRMALEQFQEYVEKIEKLRVKYRELTILIGIEADYIEGYEDYLKKFLSGYSFDIVIMSVHYIKGWPENQWVFSYEYSDQTIAHQYKEYFDTMLKGINTGLFDVVGHFDIIKRLERPVLKTNKRDVEHVLDAIKKAGMSIELNTSGLRKHINELYPSMEIVGMAVERGIPFVFASDAHKPEHVGDYFDDLFNELFQFPKLKLSQYRGRHCSSRRMIPQMDQFDHIDQQPRGIDEELIG